MIVINVLISSRYSYLSALFVEWEKLQKKCRIYDFIKFSTSVGDSTTENNLKPVVFQAETEIKAPLVSSKITVIKEIPVAKAVFPFSFICF